MYAIRIRKSDAALLKLLNYGKDVPVTPGKKMYLVVHTANHIPNEILSEKEFFAKYEPKVSGPELLDLKKSRY
jgi:hypothetical protein